MHLLNSSATARVCIHFAKERSVGLLNKKINDYLYRKLRILWDIVKLFESVTGVRFLTHTIQM